MESIGRTHRRSVGRGLSAIAALGMFTLILCAPVAMAAGYHQAGVDAARTGATTDLGPVRDDVAFERHLPGARPGEAEPLIVDGNIYAAVKSVGFEGMGTDGVVRIDRATAEVEIVADMEAAPQAMASDGDHLYVLTDGGLATYPLSGGEPAWTWAFPTVTNLPPNATDCASPAVTGDTVFLLCNQVALQDPDDGRPASDPIPGPTRPGGEAESVVFVVAVDRSTGEARWAWSEDRAPIATGPDVHQPGIVTADSAGDRAGGRLGGIAVVDDQALTMTQDPRGPAFGTTDVHLRSFEREDGTARWSYNVTVSDQAQEAAGDGSGFVEGTQFATFTPTPTGTEREVYIALRDLIAVDAEAGSEVWRRTLDQPQRDFVGGNAFALSGDSLYVTSRGVLFKIDRASQSETWARTIGVEEHFDDSPPILTDDRLYARTHYGGDNRTNYLYAYDRADGDILFKHEIRRNETRSDFTFANQFEISVGDGVMAVQGVDGTLRVLGHTPASLQPAVNVSTAYPGTDEQIRVNLTRTQPGVDGPATAFRASWGDRTTTDWQTSPVLNHTYAEPGDHEAVFQVRNAAGQTASITMTVHVGQEPPTQPNVFQEAFAPENQDLTFGILGLVVAVTGGAIGVARRHHKRSRLQEELDRLEQGFEEFEDRPSECEAFLDNRKARARSLALDGLLAEEQTSIIENRADELRRQLRQEALEEEFGFLPHALVRKAHRMLRDGEVTELETEAFLSALEETEIITYKQQALVRERIESWFARDTGGQRR